MSGRQAHMAVDLSKLNQACKLRCTSGFPHPPPLPTPRVGCLPRSDRAAGDTLHCTCICIQKVGVMRLIGVRSDNDVADGSTHQNPRPAATGMIAEACTSWWLKTVSLMHLEPDREAYGGPCLLSGASQECCRHINTRNAALGRHTRRHHGRTTSWMQCAHVLLEPAPTSS